MTSNIKKIIIDPRCRINYSSYFIEGLRNLFGSRMIEYRCLQDFNTMPSEVSTDSSLSNRTVCLPCSTSQRKRRPTFESCANTVCETPCFLRVSRTVLATSDILNTEVISSPHVFKNTIRSITSFIANRNPKLTRTGKNTLNGTSIRHFYPERENYLSVKRHLRFWSRLEA